MVDSHKKGEKDHSDLIRILDPQQRKALELFKKYDVATSHQIGTLFGFYPRTYTALCKKWTDAGFLEIVDPSNKARKYILAKPYDVLVTA